MLASLTCFCLPWGTHSRLNYMGLIFWHALVILAAHLTLTKLEKEKFFSLSNLVSSATEARILSLIWTGFCDHIFTFLFHWIMIGRLVEPYILRDDHLLPGIEQGPIVILSAFLLLFHLVSKVWICNPELITKRHTLSQDYGNVLFGHLSPLNVSKEGNGCWAKHNFVHISKIIYCVWTV